MKLFRVFLFSSLSFLVLLFPSAHTPPGGPSCAHAADLIENIGTGRINWSQALVTANGLGAPPKDLKNPAQVRAMTQRAAIFSARRNLLEVLKGVRIDSGAKIENLILSNDLFLTQVSRILRGSQVMQTKYFSDGSIEVTVGVRIRGELASILLPSSLFFSTAALPSAISQSKAPENSSAGPAPVSGEEVVPAVKESVKGQEPPAQVVSGSPLSEAERGKKKDMPQEDQPLPSHPRKGPEGGVAGRNREAGVADQDPKGGRPSSPDSPGGKAGEAKPESAPASLQATGLVVDGRGLGLKPALLPRILDEEGKVIYGVRQVGRQNALEQGLVGYSKDLSAAQKDSRVFDKPLLVKGIKALGREKTDLVISRGEAATITATLRVSNYLERSKVIIVYD